jgi:acrylyl-CoA reductase (NADPH)
MRFQALLVEEIEGRGFTRRVVERSIADLPAGEVLVKVHYSSLNYKDALSASGNRGVTRAYPHTPGIDAAGVVVSSSVPDFSPGQEVLAVSAELGVNYPGGFGQFIRVPANWLMVVPAGSIIV